MAVTTVENTTIAKPAVALTTDSNVNCVFDGVTNKGCATSTTNRNTAKKAEPGDLLTKGTI